MSEQGMCTAEKGAFPSKNELFSALVEHQTLVCEKPMRDRFAEDPERFRHFSVSAPELFLDFSKNHVDQKAIDLLCQWGEACGLSEAIQRLFSGGIVNTSERRPALHTALRQSSNQPILVNGEDILPKIRRVQDRIKTMVEAIHNRSWLGVTGKPITDIVHIGIGGSSLGPKVVCDALVPEAVPGMACHFVSNVDSEAIGRVLSKLRPETTLLCIASKTFTTIETMTNAHTAKLWLNVIDKPGLLEKHVIAMTSAPDKARAFGIPSENIFEFWDWVGGRFSLWSSIGLPIALLIGMDRFSEFLRGAEELDLHFQKAELQKNMPVLLGLLDVWYRNFFHTSSLVIVPYAEALRSFPAYLQQIMMESNGKSVSQTGEPLDHETTFAVWGDVGTDSQHAFHQALHQGTDLTLVDFIVPIVSRTPMANHQAWLVANCFAQSEALMEGQSCEAVLKSQLASGMAEEEARWRSPHLAMPGNRPSNTIVLSKLSPRSLGALIALYEHRTFVQGILWGINSFDQWGVELGKHIARSCFNLMTRPVVSAEDWGERKASSTRGLIEKYRAKMGL